MSHPSGKFFDKMDRESTLLKETNKAHAAFLLYAAMGPSRTLDKVRLQLGAKPSYARVLWEWSRKYHWQQRVRAYDVEAAQEELRQAERELKKMNDRHAQAANTSQLAALEYITKLVKSNKLGSIAAVQWLKNSFDLERLARGATTETSRVELTGPGGGPVETDTLVRVYLPQKDSVPGVAHEQSEPAHPPSLPETAESLKQWLAQQVAASLSPRQDA